MKTHPQPLENVAYVCASPLNNRYMPVVALLHHHHYMFKKAIVAVMSTFLRFVHLLSDVSDDYFLYKLCQVTISDLVS